MKVRFAILICLMSAPCAKPAFAIVFGPTSVEGCYNYAGAVFSGLAVSCDTISPGKNMLFPQGAEAWTFSVGQVWKGPIVSRIVVQTGLRLPHSLFPFEIGKQYVVFAYWYFDHKSLEVGRYSPTAEVNAAIAQRYFLGQAEVVNQALSLPPISDEEGRKAEYKCPYFIDASPDPPALDLLDIDTNFH